MEYGNDEEADIIPSAIAHTEATISQLRLQYDESRRNQYKLEERLAGFIKNCSCQVPQGFVSIATQSSGFVLATKNVASQSERHFPESDDRFYQRVDEIIEQNKKLNSNIFILQKQLKDMDIERHVLESDLNQKHSQSIQKLQILQRKQESSYHDRIQKLEKERTESLCSLDPQNNSLSDTLHLTDENSIIQEGGELVQKIESMMETLKESLSSKDIKGSNDINKVRFEKDSALKKCLRLDTQLNAMKKSKDNLVGQVKMQEEELSSLRLFYNLHQSLSQEASLRDQYNEKVLELSERLKQRETELLSSQRENDTLAAMIKRLERKVDMFGQGGKLTNGPSKLPPMLLNNTSRGSTNNPRASNKRFSSSNSSMNSPIL